MAEESSSPVLLKPHSIVVSVYLNCCKKGTMWISTVYQPGYYYIYYRLDAGDQVTHFYVSEKTLLMV